MKKTAALLLGVILTANIQALAQPPPRGRGGRPHGMQSQEQTETLTDEQKAGIKEVLSGYDAESLTKEDAEAIHEKFQELGVHGGPDLATVLKEAGFDPETLRKLAPPPPREGEQNGSSPRQSGNR